jgi:hypothetical protein
VKKKKKIIKTSISTPRSGAPRGDLACALAVAAGEPTDDAVAAAVQDIADRADLIAYVDVGESGVVVVFVFFWGGETINFSQFY